MTDGDGPISGAGSGLIYCGLCGALNSASRHYCAACGTTLVDAFHATEGIRVFERADPAARVIEIVAAGVELEPVVGTQDVPQDWVRVRLVNGKLGYVRRSDVTTASPTPSSSTPCRASRSVGRRPRRADRPACRRERRRHPDALDPPNGPARLSEVVQVFSTRRRRALPGIQGGRDSWPVTTA